MFVVQGSGRRGGNEVSMEFANPKHFVDRPDRVVQLELRRLVAVLDNRFVPSVAVDLLDCDRQHQQFFVNGNSAAGDDATNKKFIALLNEKMELACGEDNDGIFAGCPLFGETVIGGWQSGVSARLPPFSEVRFNSKECLHILGFQEYDDKGDNELYKYGFANHTDQPAEFYSALPAPPGGYVKDNPAMMYQFGVKVQEDMEKFIAELRRGDKRTNFGVRFVRRCDLRRGSYPLANSGALVDKPTSVTQTIEQLTEVTREMEAVLGLRPGVVAWDKRYDGFNNLTYAALVLVDERRKTDARIALRFSEHTAKMWGMGGVSSTATFVSREKEQSAYKKRVEEAKKRTARARESAAEMAGRKAEDDAKKAIKDAAAARKAAGEKPLPRSSAGAEVESAVAAAEAQAAAAVPEEQVQPPPPYERVRLRIFLSGPPGWKYGFNSLSNHMPYYLSCDAFMPEDGVLGGFGGRNFMAVATDPGGEIADALPIAIRPEYNRVLFKLYSQNLEPIAFYDDYEVTAHFSMYQKESSN